MKLSVITLLSHCQGGDGEQEGQDKTLHSGTRHGELSPLTDLFTLSFQILAVPFSVGVLNLDPPFAFVSLFCYYLLGNTTSLLFG